MINREATNQVTWSNLVRSGLNYAVDGDNRRAIAKTVPGKPLKNKSTSWSLLDILPPCMIKPAEQGRLTANNSEYSIGHGMRQ